jgi:hypothetical protein
MMGNLKPGATYIYERNGNTVYAREMGSDPNTRKPIGWDYKVNGDTFAEWQDNRSESQKDLDDHNEWIKIRVEAKTNPALQKAVDRVKILYKLSKEKYE